MVENAHEKSNINEKPRRKAGEKNVWIYKTRGTRLNQEDRFRSDTNTHDVSCDENKLTDTQIINNSISNVPVVCTNHNNTPANQFKCLIGKIWYLLPWLHWLKKYYIIIFYFFIWYSKKNGFQ